MATLFETHNLSEKYDFACILCQTLLSIFEKYILIFIFAQISYSLYLGANRLFSYNSYKALDAFYML